MRRVDVPVIAEPTVAARQNMDDILFHPETSIRRALILALGIHGADALSPRERDTLVDKLLDLYRNDLDAGIHGAAEWTLRQWSQHEKIRAIDAELSELKQRDGRRWYVNRRQQTFALVMGPLEFRMGSQPNDPERNPDEILHHRLIPRRFAIATKEVTVEQYQEFLNQNPKIARLRIGRYSPEPTGPMNAMRWYEAAAYCNWVSRQDALAECYDPNRSGDYDEGMTIRPDALEREGYRLPTESEWEFACRAGAATTRYFGRSTQLLEKYGYARANSKRRAWPVGSLLPNDLGLFDMLGNVEEWCLDRYVHLYDLGKSITIDRLLSSKILDGREIFACRGSSFDGPAIDVRSAGRRGNRPADRNGLTGFRLVRTYK